MSTLAGTTLDKYDVLEEVGHGGMAVVYRGRDRALHREVAVKVLHPHLADRSESRLRLQREAIAVAKLRHENILEIFDYSGVAASQSYIVTEFIHGPTLREWIDQEYQPRPGVAALIVQRLALALARAHAEGVVHRDIKPENVMIRREDGCIKLMDFGIAQILDNQKLTMTGQLIGSPAYMAPELITGRPLDARTDLFSLGILLYQLATGELPFSGRNPHEVLNRIADGNYPAPGAICPLVDADLEAIIHRALASNPEDRYQSADSMAADLKAYLDDLEVSVSAQELWCYFDDPKRYIANLDERVVATLMTRAEEAGREGTRAQAIRLLARVLELDPKHPRARQLLSRLRIREQRMRRLLMAGGALAFVGMLGAGLLLSPDGALRASSHHGKTLAANSVEGPEVGASDPAKAAGPKDSSVAGTPPPNPDVVLSRGGPGPGPDTGPGAQPSTEVARPDAGEPRARRESGGETRSPVRAVVERQKVRTDCTLEFTGIGINPARNVEVRVGDVSMPITALRMTVEFPDTKAEVRISDRRWQASRTVRRDECAQGPVKIPVHPKPARLNFQNAPADLAVICIRGCPKEQLQQARLARSFPEMRFDPGTDQRRVTLKLKHPEYEDTRIDTMLEPGDNEIPVRMDRRP